MNKSDFLYISHRGFGEKAFPRYAKTNKLQFVHNQLTGLELGLEKGANTLEIDLNKTKDGKIVTTHGIPFAKRLSVNAKEFFSQNPEALTLDELIDWLHHQSQVKLYLELKTDINIQEIVQTITSYAESMNSNQQRTIEDLYERIMIYAEDINFITSLLKQKNDLDLSTSQLKVFAVTNLLLTKQKIDFYTSLGTNKSTLYGIEQGAFIWANPLVLNILKSPLKNIYPIKRLVSFYTHLSQIIGYAHEKNLLFLFGTVDDSHMIAELVKQGIDGIVPNNPEYFGTAIF